MPLKKMNFVKKERIEPLVTATSNPYVKGSDGRKEWNDRYFNLSDTIFYWRTAFFVLLGVTALFSLLMVKMAMHSRVEPYVVALQNGVPATVFSASETTKEDPRLIRFALSQFIINSRTQLSDSAAEKTLIDNVYAYSAGSTIPFLRRFYQVNNPFTRAQIETITIHIENTLPLSKHTWQVLWTETKRNRTTGEILAKTHWMAELTYKFGKVNGDFINQNPFGIYITNVNWAESNQ